jgi:hypothetical protein
MYIGGQANNYKINQESTWFGTIFAHTHRDAKLVKKITTIIYSRFMFCHGRLFSCLFAIFFAVYEYFTKFKSGNVFLYYGKIEAKYI